MAKNTASAAGLAHEYTTAAIPPTPRESAKVEEARELSAHFQSLNQLLGTDRPFQYQRKSRFGEIDVLGCYVRVTLRDGIDFEAHETDLLETVESYAIMIDCEYEWKEAFTAFIRGALGVKGVRVTDVIGDTNILILCQPEKTREPSEMIWDPFAPAYGNRVSERFYEKLGEEVKA
ncbi:MAG: hypothetical protein ABFD60_04330 [Bryobacteraceae bacterium]